MLSWFAPTCPLETGLKTWVERRLRWLLGALGPGRILGAEMVLPDDRFFPDGYAATPGGAAAIFVRVCGFMGVDPTRVGFEILPADQMPDAVGLYHPGERPRIEVSDSQLADFERLVAVIAHELAHDILLGGGLIGLEEEDGEHLTDLLPAFLGLGLFSANAPMRDRRDFINGQYAIYSEFQGYLPSRTFGYALALSAYIRGEEAPAWARHLRPDAAAPFRQGLRYLRKTGDALVGPGDVGPFAAPSEPQILAGLAHGSATFRASALLDAVDMKDPSPALVRAAIAALDDPDVDVQVEAARAIAAFGEAAADAAPTLIDRLASGDADLRRFAARALSAQRSAAARLVPALARLLDDPVTGVVDEAAAALYAMAADATPAIPALVEAIRRRAVDCRHDDWPAAAIVAIDPSGEAVAPHLEPIEPEIRRRIERSLRLARMRSRAAAAEAQDAPPPSASSRQGSRLG